MGRFLTLINKLSNRRSRPKIGPGRATFKKQAEIVPLKMTQMIKFNFSYALSQHRHTDKEKDKRATLCHAV
jgi:hypothetical protein